jgi:hypothetical protein
MENVGMFMAIWSILRPFGIFRFHLVYFMFFWCIFSRFGIFYQEKSGNPETYLVRRLDSAVGPKMAPKFMKEEP